MNEEDRKRFESLHALSEQGWRDWDHKSKAEWKLSFAIWVALLASSAAVGKAEVRVTQWIVIPIVAVVTGLHLLFMRYIHKTLTLYREQMRLCQIPMINLLGIKWEDPLHRKHWFIHPSFWLQLGITLLLGAILIFLSVSSQSTIKESSVSVIQRVIP